MIRVIRAEWIKIVHSRVFWLMLGAYCLLYFATVGLVSNVFDNLTINGQRLEIGFMSGPQAWLAIGWIGRWFAYLLGFVVIQLVCNEIEYRTVRQNIIDGYSELEYFVGKVTTVLGLALVATILYIVIAVTTAGPHFDSNAVSGFALGCAGTLSLAMMFAFFLQRTGPASFLFLAYPLIVEPIINHFASEKISPTIENFLPATAFSRLTRLPTLQPPIEESHNFPHYFLVATAVLIGVWGLTYLWFLMSDR